jgi:hypothetical protein
MTDEKTVTVPNAKLAAAIKVVAREKRNGEWRINTSQGSPSGTHKWIEKLPADKPPLRVD